MLADLLRRTSKKESLRTEVSGVAVHILNHDVRVYNLDGSVRWSTATTMFGNSDWTAHDVRAISSTPNDQVLILKSLNSTTLHRLWVLDAFDGSPIKYIDVTTAAFSSDGSHGRYWGKTVELSGQPYVLFHCGDHTQIFAYNWETETLYIARTMSYPCYHMGLSPTEEILLVGTSQYSYGLSLADPSSLGAPYNLNADATSMRYVTPHYNQTHVCAGRITNRYNLDLSPYTEGGTLVSTSVAPVAGYNIDTSTYGSSLLFSRDGKAMFHNQSNTGTINIKDPSGSVSTWFVTGLSISQGTNIAGGNTAPVPDPSGRYKFVAANVGGFVVISDYTTKDLDVALGTDAPLSTRWVSPVFV